MTFVLDNSVAMRWLLPGTTDRHVAYAAAVVRYLTAGSSCMAPSLWPIELANVLARCERTKSVTPRESEDFLRMVVTLDVEIDERTSAMAWTETLELCRTHGLSAYDAAYLELAIRRSSPLATLDKDLIKAAKRTGVRVFDV